MDNTPFEIEESSQWPTSFAFDRSRRRSRIALLVFVSLVLLSAFGNIILTIYFCDFGGGGPPPLYFVALAMLLAQPCLLSIWLVLANQRLWVRLVVFNGILGGLILTYLKAFDLAKSPVPMDVAGVIIGIAIALSIVIQTPLWIFRGVTQLSIRLPVQDPALSEKNQFSIKHLLVAMTIAAMIVAGTQAMLPEIIFQDFGPAPWRAIIPFLLFFIILIGLVGFVALAVVFSAKQRIIFGALAVLFLLLAPLASIKMMKSSTLFGPMGWDWQATANTYLFVWTLGSVLMGVLGIFYLIGYRLEKAPS